MSCLLWAHGGQWRSANSGRCEAQVRFGRAGVIAQGGIIRRKPAAGIDRGRQRGRRHVWRGRLSLQREAQFGEEEVAAGREYQVVPWLVALGHVAALSRAVAGRDGRVDPEPLRRRPAQPEPGAADARVHPRRDGDDELSVVHVQEQLRAGGGQQRQEVHEQRQGRG